jgi:hypothetical protein
VERSKGTRGLTRGFIKVASRVRVASRHLRVPGSQSHHALPKRSSYLGYPCGRPDLRGRATSAHEHESRAGSAGRGRAAGGTRACRAAAAGAGAAAAAASGLRGAGLARLLRRVKGGFDSPPLDISITPSMRFQ